MSSRSLALLLTLLLGALLCHAQSGPSPTTRELTDLKQQVELLKQQVADLKLQFRTDYKSETRAMPGSVDFPQADAQRRQLADSLRQQIKGELKYELKQELKNELRQELKQELKQELQQELRRN